MILERDNGVFELYDVNVITSKYDVAITLKAFDVSCRVSAQELVIVSSSKDTLYLAPSDVVQTTYASLNDVTIVIDYSEFETLYTLTVYSKKIRVHVSRVKYFIDVSDVD